MKQAEIRHSRRQQRHQRIREKVKGTTQRTRLVVFRGISNISAQIIDDTQGCTLVSASSFEKRLKGAIKSGGNVEAARLIGKQIAELAKAKSIHTVVFDRGGYVYHGRVKALAEAARENGLQF